MITKLSVAVVQGGPSSEAEVSRASAAGVAKALETAGHRVDRIELDRGLPAALVAGGFDVVFPVVHGAVGEDGSLQGLLEVLAIPYVGCDVLASALAMDKRVARVLFEAAGLPVAKGIAFPRGASDGAAGAALRARTEIGRRLVVKPGANGSAIGVSRLEEDAPDDEVARAIAAVWELGDVALVEHFAKGKEVTCGVLDVGPHARALPPTEVRSPNDAFYTFEARYAPGRSEHFCPAPLGDALVKRVQEIAVAAHVALGCRDLCRVDFVVGDANETDVVTLLEVNTMPGFTATSLYPEAAAVAGIDFPTLCDGFVVRAHTRGTKARNAPRHFPG
ncbi:MAG: D-alanine--D-alanine ligase [Polyangiaceae bacterium]